MFRAQDIIFKKNIEVDKNNKVNNIIEYEKNYEDYIIIYIKESFYFQMRIFDRIIVNSKYFCRS